MRGPDVQGRQELSSERQGSGVGGRTDQVVAVSAPPSHLVPFPSTVLKVTKSYLQDPFTSFPNEVARVLFFFFPSLLCGLASQGIWCIQVPWTVSSMGEF